MKNVDIKSILYEIRNNIGFLIFNDPPTNKMTIDFFNTLNQIIMKEINQNQIRALIMYGNGRHFSSGADLESFLPYLLRKTRINLQGKITKYPDRLIDNIRSFTFFENLKIPVIAAIRGACIGSAMELALCCHIRICGEGSFLALPESTFSLLPGCGGTIRLPRVVGYAKAMELIIKGNNISAEDALKMGLLEAVVPKKIVIEHSVKFAEFLVQKSVYRKERVKQYIKEYFS